MLKPPPTAPLMRRVIRASLLVAALGTTTCLLSACPGFQLVSEAPPVQVQPDALKLDTPIMVHQPSLKSVSALQSAGYRVLSDPAVYFETPVAGAEVRAVPTTGGLTILGTTDAQGRVILRLDINKVYTIVATFKDPDGQDRSYKTFTKVTEQDKAAPPTQPLNFASTLISEAIAGSRNAASLATLDVSKVHAAIASTQEVLKAKPTDLTAVFTTTNTQDPAAVAQALQAISLVKQLDPSLAAKTDPLDALSQAQSSVDPSNSLEEGGVPSASPPATPPAPPVVAPPIQKPPTTVQSFDFVEGPSTVYLPFSNGATDSAYPQAQLLKVRTVMTSGIVLPLAYWSFASGAQETLSVDGGLLKVRAGAQPGTATVRATSLSDAGNFRDRIVTIAETPRRVLSLTLSLPAGTPELYVPADGMSVGDNNLDHPTALQLGWEMAWNDRAVSRAPDAADQVDWISKTPTMVSVDASGRVSARPGSPEGTAIVEVKTRTQPSVSAEIAIPLRRDAAIVVDIK